MLSFQPGPVLTDRSLILKTAPELSCRVAAFLQIFFLALQAIFFTLEKPDGL
jgi:hypothetical protein